MKRSKKNYKNERDRFTKIKDYKNKTIKDL